jgi:uncharacterized cupredoxin-like copper-binding protein
MRGRAVLAVAAAALLGVAGCNDDPAEGALGPGTVTVDLELHHSRFRPARLRVVEGTTVRFVVRNTDPIDHELIVGDAAVHRRHERGTEPYHPPKPGEVSVAAGETAETTYEFTEPGTVEMACHLPRHLGYGMRGEIEVAAGR